MQAQIDAASLKFLKLILRNREEQFDDFKKYLESEFGLNWSKLEDQRITSRSNDTFKKLTETLLKAKKVLSRQADADAAQLRDFYITCIEDLLQSQGKSADLKSHVEFKSDEFEKADFFLEKGPPKVVVELVTTSFEPKNVKKQVDLIQSMLPYLMEKGKPTYSRLVGFLLSFDGVEIVWIDEFLPGKAPVKCRLFEFSWSSYTFHMLFDHLEKKDSKLEELDSMAYKGISDFYVFLWAFCKIVCHEKNQ